MNKIKPHKSLEEVAASVIPFLSKHRIVMLGEASHGTQEYYKIRRLITETLIKEHGFNFIGVEGDWPDCYSLNDFIRETHYKKEKTPVKPLKHFKRWPTWMWSNTEIEEMVENLRKINEERPKDKQVGFYGLDVYSLFDSIDKVIHELSKVDPSLGELARSRYECFFQFNRDENKYLKHLLKKPEGCREGVIKMLSDLLKIRIKEAKGLDEQTFFNIKQNANIVFNAEDYYRTMMLGNDDSWNVRDRHMLETLDSIFEGLYPNGKAIIWAHNTHIGDYKYTDMKDQGEINLGGLVREKYGEENVALLGFGTYKGSVIASSNWGGKIESMVVPEAKEGSHDLFLHNLCNKFKTPIWSINFKEMDDKDPQKKPFLEKKGQRAIGVVYRPNMEWGNYVPTILAKRYDSFIFLDETQSLKPVFVTMPDLHEIPHDYPFGA